MEKKMFSCCALVTEGVVKLEREKTQQISHQLKFDGGNVTQFHLGVLSTYSYLLCSCDAAILIDPGRDVGRYGEFMREHHMRLCGVFLTHMHSDFVSGHIEAGEIFNVPVFVGRDSAAGFSHIPIDDGANFSLGRLKLNFFSAPGHSDDGICMTVGADPEHPDLIFTGDALDVHSTQNRGMDWLQKLEQYSNDIKLFPAHEIPGAAYSWTTLGEEKQRNALFNPRAEKNPFLSREQLHLDYLREINRSGPPVVDWEKAFTLVEPEFSFASSDSRVVDIRNTLAYAEKHIPFSLNIEENGRLEYWCTVLFDPAKGEIILTGDDAQSLAECSIRLQAMGFKVCGFLFDEWEKAGFPVSVSQVVEPDDLETLVWSDNTPLLLDVRSAEEWQKSRINGSVNIPLRELPHKLNTLSRDRDIVLVCASGFRAAIASGILERGGFRSICNLNGGLGAWLENGKSLDFDQTPVPSNEGIKS